MEDSMYVPGNAASICVTYPRRWIMTKETSVFWLTRERHWLSLNVIFGTKVSGLPCTSFNGLEICKSTAKHPQTDRRTDRNIGKLDLHRE